jgi:chromosome segregation ATPase
VQVEKAAAESEIKRQEVQRNSREVDDLLQQIAVQRKQADEKMAQIEIDTEKINKEKAEAEQIAAEAQADLAVYEPELLAAEEEIKKLDGKSIAEIKAYTTPPKLVMTVLNAVMIILGHEPSWQSAKKNMDAKFLKTIMEYEKDKTPS